MNAEHAPVDRVLNLLRGIGAFVLVAAICLALLNGWTSYRACEASKDDRIDNAAAWTAHGKYITKVTGAASVREDVKSAARMANRTYQRISRSLTSRARVSCVPPTSWLH